MGQRDPVGLELVHHVFGDFPLAARDTTVAAQSTTAGSREHNPTPSWVTAENVVRMLLHHAGGIPGNIDRRSSKSSWPLTRKYRVRQVRVVVHVLYQSKRWPQGILEARFSESAGAVIRWRIVVAGGAQCS